QLLSLFSFFLFLHVIHFALPSFPTRRSSDLRRVAVPRRQPPAAAGGGRAGVALVPLVPSRRWCPDRLSHAARRPGPRRQDGGARSEEHTSELQSLRHLVCRLLLEKKKTSYYK